MRAILPILALSTLGLIAAPITPAWAQNAKPKANDAQAKKTARELAQAGLEAFEKGEFEQAVELFEQAEGEWHAIVHQVYLARAKVKLGRLVEAREHYRSAAYESLSDNVSAVFKELQAEAKVELAELEPRIPKMKLVIEGAATKDVRVTLDGKTLPPATLKIAIMVDPAKHEIEAVGEGIRGKASETFAEGELREVVIKMQPDPTATLKEPKGKGAKGAKESTKGSTTDPTVDSHGRPLRVGGFVSLGVGVGGAVLGTVFLVNAGKKKSDRDDLAGECEQTSPLSCTSDQEKSIRELEDEEASAKTLGAVGYIVGGVGVATGVTLLILDASKNKKNSKAKRSVRPFVGFNTVGVEGRF